MTKKSRDYRKSKRAHKMLLSEIDRLSRELLSHGIKTQYSFLDGTINVHLNSPGGSI